MALIVITLCDDPDGQLDISVKAEPFLPGPASKDEPTPAQTATLIMLSTFAHAMADEEAAEDAAPSET